MKRVGSKRLKIQRFRIESREQWLALRAGDVTASAVGALFGLHPHQTAMGLFAEKTGIELPDEDTLAMRRGRLLETAVAEAFREERPTWKIVKARHYWRAPDLRLGATPDYFVFDPEGRKGVLQCKTVSPLAFKRSWTDETPPTWISLQTATEAMLTKADFGLIAALIVDGFRFELKLYFVPRHQGAERRLQEGVANFWRDIAAGKTPEFTADDRSLLYVIYPREQPGKVVDLRGDNRLPELLEERDKLRGEIEEKTDRQRAIETMLIAKIGNAEAALVSGYRITFKEQHRKAYSVKEANFRVLRIAKEKQEEAA